MDVPKSNPASAAITPEVKAQIHKFWPWYKSPLHGQQDLWRYIYPRLYLYGLQHQQSELPTLTVSESQPKIKSDTKTRLGEIETPAAVAQLIQPYIVKQRVHVE